MRKHVALRTVGATRTGQWQLWPPLEAIPQSPALWAGIIYFDPDAIFAEAKKAEVCPFETQLELAGGADAIVADYNYVFEPGVALRRLEPEDEPVLLVDEAHNLPDRARKIFSPELLQEAFRNVAGRLLLQPGELFEALSTHVPLTSDTWRSDVPPR